MPWRLPPSLTLKAAANSSGATRRILLTTRASLRASSFKWRELELAVRGGASFRQIEGPCGLSAGRGTADRPRLINPLCAAFIA